MVYKLIVYLLFIKKLLSILNSRHNFAKNVGYKMSQANRESSHIRTSANDTMM